MPIFNYIVGADQDFGGVDVSREEMIKWFGLESVINWEIEAIINDRRIGFAPTPSILIGVVSLPVLAIL